jgi:hypothetical protein
MAHTLAVKNFERFQHYKDRNPLWIKLYYELLDDYAFANLPDASKWHLVAIWLLASRNKGVVPSDSKWLAKKIGATEKLNLEILIANGFLIASKLLAEPERVAISERETEKDSVPSELAQAPMTPIDLKDQVWKTGVAYLKSKSIPDATARKLVGKWRKDSTDAAILNALARSELENAQHPESFITAILKGKSGGKQRDDGQARRAALAGAFADQFGDGAERPDADQSEGAGDDAAGNSSPVAATSGVRHHVEILSGSPAGRAARSGRKGPAIDPVDLEILSEACGDSPSAAGRTGPAPEASSGRGARSPELGTAPAGNDAGRAQTGLGNIPLDQGIAETLRGARLGLAAYDRDSDLAQTIEGMNRLKGAA